LKFFAAALPLLLVIQITLGALTVLTRKDVALTTAHVATGAALLVVSVLMTLHVFRYRNVAWRREPGIASHLEAIA
jgi:heme A synthase